MAYAREAMGGGISAGTAKALNGQIRTLAAAGSTVTDAALTTTSNTYVTPVSSGQGVIIADGEITDTVIVFNAGANPLKVYPPTGDAFNQLSVNTGFTLAQNTGCLIMKVSSSLWLVFMSA